MLGKRRVSALAPPSGQIAAPATAHAHADSCNVGGNSGPPKRRSQRAPNECTPNCCTSIDSRSAQPVGGTSTYSLIHQTSTQYPCPPFGRPCSSQHSASRLIYLQCRVAFAGESLIVLIGFVSSFRLHKIIVRKRVLLNWKICMSCLYYVRSSSPLPPTPPRSPSAPLRARSLSLLIFLS